MIRYCPKCNKNIVGKPDAEGKMKCPKCQGKTEPAKKGEKVNGI